MATTKQIKIDGHSLQHSPDGQWHKAVPADEDNCPAHVINEIACEIIDGRRPQCDDYVASNGLHYRW